MRNSDDLKKVGNKNLNNIKKLDDSELSTLSAGVGRRLPMTNIIFRPGSISATFTCYTCGSSYRVDSRDYGTPHKVPYEALICRNCGTKGEWFEEV